MPSRDRIVIGASAGGIEALLLLFGRLPAELPAAIFVVVHFPSESTSLLPEILTRAGNMPAMHAVDGEMIRSGRIYVAPPDHHLILQQSAIRLSRGPREHGFRPAIDPLFRSATQVYGPRVISVILSGNLSDGVAGLQAVQRAGGVALVQDPSEALFPDLPANAIASVRIDRVLPAAEIAEELKRLTQQTEQEGESLSMSDENKQESLAVQQDMAAYEKGESITQRTVLTCPDCGGLIWELQDGQLFGFRCHVGHAYSSDSLLVRQGEALETALWTAIRALEERAALLRRLATLSEQRSLGRMVEKYTARADEVERQADIVRLVLMNGKGLGLDQDLLGQQELDADMLREQDPDPGDESSEGRSERSD
jgi:two-component system chemotaxis response regulator CheB